MRLDRVRIQGYRSLEDLTFEPGDFTVLVGPNGAGKSNIVRALGFLAEVYRSGLTSAIDREGGFDNLAYYGESSRSNTITFEVDMTVDAREIEAFKRQLVEQQLAKSSSDGNGEIVSIRAYHRFSVQSVGGAFDAPITVEAEDIRVDVELNDGRRPWFGTNRRSGEPPKFVLSNEFVFETGEPIDTWKEGFDDTPAFWGVVNASELLVDGLMLRNQLLGSWSRALARMRWFQITPAAARTPSSPMPNPNLEADGTNLPSRVYHLQQQRPSAWHRVMEAMHSLLPSLERIEIESTFNRRLTMFFHQTGAGRSWTVNEVSDGTIRALGLFVALADPDGSLIAVEEPENSVHPWVVRTFTDLCREISGAGSGQQVVITTHSPALIDYVRPDELVVVWQEDEATRLCPLDHLDPAAREAWAAGDVSLFELMDSGVLRQTVPVGV